LQQEGLIERYQVDGLRIVRIPTFLAHQNPHRNESDSVLPDPTSDHGAKDVVPRTEALGLNPDSLNPDSLNPEKREGAPAGAAPAKKGTRIPDGFPTADELDWAEAECPHVDSNVEAAKFIDYWRGVPGQKGVKLDWPATWRNWIRRAAENGQPRKRDGPDARLSVIQQAKAMRAGR
ncbi:MAG: hypothetical protein ACOC0Q_10440, partial [Wenzhouxiangella sp.]